MLALAACCPDPIRIKPNGALTTPMYKNLLVEGDTLRDLATKYELNLEVIDEGNKRFEQIRE